MSERTDPEWAFDMPRDEAIALAATGWWRGKDAREIATFQLACNKLAMNFSDYHEALEVALGRGVFTHEMASRERLWAELHGDAPAPTMREIIGLIPEEKRVIVLAGGG